MNYVGRGIASGLCTLLILGCNKTPSPPPTLPTATEPAEVTRPTTQELTSGPYKTIILPGMPLSIRVPQSWKLEAASSITFLEGPAPEDDIIIQLAQHATLNSDQMSMLFATAQEDFQKHPQAVKQMKITDLGQAKLLEKLTVSAPLSTPLVDANNNAITDAKGNIMMQTVTPARWTLTVFAPYQSSYTQYELNFIDMTMENYSRNKPFLDKIAASLSYLSGSPTTAP